MVGGRGGGRNDDGVGGVNGRRDQDGGCSDCCQIAGPRKYPPGINTRTLAEQVEALLAGTQEFYHTSGELTGYMICIFSWPLLRTIPEEIACIWLIPFAAHRTFQTSTTITHCQTLRPLYAHFTKILGAFLFGIRNTFPTLHNIRGFTILTTAGDLQKPTSFLLRNVLNLSPTLVL